MPEPKPVRDEINLLFSAHSPALSSRERLIMRMRLEDGRTLTQIAYVFGLSRERIRQIEVEAVEKLRSAPDA